MKRNYNKKKYTESFKNMLDAIVIQEMRILRAKFDISQYEMAADLNVLQCEISRIFRGKAYLSIYDLLLLSIYFHFDLFKVISDNPEIQKLITEQKPFDINNIKAYKTFKEENYIEEE